MHKKESDVHKTARLCNRKHAPPKRSSRRKGTQRAKTAIPIPAKARPRPLREWEPESRHDGAEESRAAGRMAYTSVATTSSRDWGSRSMTGISGIV